MILLALGGFRVLGVRRRILGTEGFRVTHRTENPLYPGSLVTYGTLVFRKPAALLNRELKSSAPFLNLQWRGGLRKEALKP